MPSDNRPAGLKQFVTPKGVAKFPALNAPDTLHDKDGIFKVGLLLPPDEAQVLIDLLKPHLDEAVAWAKRENPRVAKSIVAHSPWADEVDREGNETGLIEFKFKAKAKGKRKDGTTFDRRIPLFDAVRTPITKNVGGGSVIKVSAAAVAYFAAATKQAGITLRLNAVQVLELREFGARDAAGFGFGEEDGFSASGDDASGAAPSGSATSDDDAPPF